MSRLIPPLTLLAGLLGGAACNDGSTDGPSTALVSGRVLDDVGVPVPQALIVVEGAPDQTSTDAKGRFQLEVPRGSRRMVVSQGGLLLCEACFSVGPARTMDLGDMYPGRETGCGTPVFCSGDSDCDGIADGDELAGWDVTVVLGDGTSTTRRVSSDPFSLDSDGDGLTDFEELAVRTDPMRRDTDGDLLPDFGELFSYKSNPCMVDTDMDGRGPEGVEVSDPNLWDGFELRYLGTSPTLADTDGDGLTDWEEVHSGGINPLLADLPDLSLDLQGDPTIVLNVTDITASEALVTNLERDTDGYERTDTESTRMSIENTVSIHTELEAGTGTWPPSFNAKVTTDTEFKHGYATESLSSWTEASVRESQASYEEWASKTTDYSDGMLWAAIKLTNSSGLSFKVRDLRLVAYRMKSNGAFEAIGNLGLGTLGPDNEWLPFEEDASEFVLGPSAEFTDLVGADHLPPQIMRALVANPTALLLEIGSYSLYKLDEFGNATTSFAALGETVVQRTGLIVIDYGNGRVERHMVATNVYRHPDGSGRGLTLREALSEVIGVGYESTLQTEVENPRRVLTRVGPVATYVDDADPAIRGFWIVAGTSSLFDQELEVDFDDIVLRSGDRITLTYVEDSDGDGIFNREEYLLHTNPLRADSDEDGLSDFEESKVGWDVVVQGRTPRRVYPDPRFADLDDDYLVDGSEAFLGTDPYNADTDGDEMDDGFDADPLDPPCLSGTSLFLAAWLDGSIDAGSPTTASDVWISDEFSTDGTLSRAEIATLLGGENVFSLNSDAQVLDFIDISGESISPPHEFSVGAWIWWSGNDPLEEWGTVLTKGERTFATYAVSINSDGILRGSVFRLVHDKCKLGSWDGGCADGYWNELTEAVSDVALPQSEWAHVVLTFGPEFMKLYLDGQKVGEVDVNISFRSGANNHHYHTEYLHRNGLPLRLGLDVAPVNPEGRFRGFLDDLQYYHRELGPEEVGQVYQLGICGE